MPYGVRAPSILYPLPPVPWPTYNTIYNHQVQAMEVLHPLEGAVYWEGPVNVSLEVTLTGANTFLGVVFFFFVRDSFVKGW